MYEYFERGVVAKLYNSIQTIEKRFFVIKLLLMICAFIISTYLLELRAVNQKRLPEIPLLHQAVLSGNIKAVEKFLSSKKFDPDHVDSCGRTAAHAAAENGNFLIIQLLANYKANFNMMNKWGRTPLDVALSNKHFKIVEFLLKFCTTYNDKNNKELENLTSSFSGLSLSQK